MNWPHGCVRHAEPLSNHTSFRIGGPAEWFAEPSTTEELTQVLQAAHARSLPVVVLGGGTNSLVADRGVRGLVLHLGKGFRDVTVLSNLSRAEARDGASSTVRLRCGAAVTTQRVVSLASQEGWGGLETLAGLPGQIGGAIAMNAQSIGRFVEEVALVSLDGQLRQLGRKDIPFAYRYAGLPSGIIVEAVLQFPRVSPEESADPIRQALCRRNATQELSLPSAGCAFKNPPGMSAGRLIDETGLKGTRIGDAMVSWRHANFIVNVGQATCDDVLSLMEHIQRHVAKHTGVHLEPEVRLVGERFR